MFSDDILSTIGDVIVFGSQAKEIHSVIDGWTVVMGGPIVQALSHWAPVGRVLRTAEQTI